MVDQFNTQFSQWTKKYGARATFGWQYGNGVEKQIKALEIVAIDKIIWRKPPPKGLGEMMHGTGPVGSTSSR